MQRMKRISLDSQKLSFKAGVMQTNPLYAHYADLTQVWREKIDQSWAFTTGVWGVYGTVLKNRDHFGFVHWVMCCVHRTGLGERCHRVNWNVTNMTENLETERWPSSRTILKTNLFRVAFVGSWGRRSDGWLEGRQWIRAKIRPVGFTLSKPIHIIWLWLINISRINRSEATW